eukprot:3224935-Rhodomonas_salina.1
MLVGRQLVPCATSVPRRQTDLGGKGGRSVRFSAPALAAATKACKRTHPDTVRFSKMRVVSSRHVASTWDRPPPSSVPKAKVH